ncbi:MULTISPECIES: glycosyltransferase [Sphingopyxis]|uniref:glycosyltransferase n=1 Tax=Sphingopyxis TaxID=165697 RepID=UPI0016468B32|nr:MULTISPECIES: glycosyltransferase [Sphingopyxis]QXF11816.1 glycosyltransferase family 4 protein [Sphingopyxis terrae subsp. terrae]
MKILFLTSSMEGGGAERVAALLSSAWGARGDDVTLIPTFSGRGGCAFPLSDSVQLEFLSDLVGNGAGKFTRLRTLRALIRARHPDVIISFLPHVNCAAILAAWGLGIPVIACERIFPPLFEHLLPRPYRLLRRLLYPAAAGLVGQTEPASRWLRDCAPRSTVATIPNPVILPLPATEPGPVPDAMLAKERKLILWAGRFEDQKRPELLIDAFAEVAASAPDWDVAMLGDGPMRAAMREKVEAAELSDRILLPGFASNLGEWYKRAELFVMTSKFEGFPNTLLEAMAHGIASIAYDVPTGPAELSDGGRRIALLPNSQQVVRLAAQMERLISDGQAREAAARAALEVRDAYSMDSIVAQWDELFEMVRQGRTQRGGEHISS